jgi:hypothetical protein
MPFMRRAACTVLKYFTPPARNDSLYGQTVLIGGQNKGGIIYFPTLQGHILHTFLESEKQILLIPPHTSCSGGAG